MNLIMHIQFFYELIHFFFLKKTIIKQIRIPNKERILQECIAYWFEIHSVIANLLKIKKNYDE